ncbi:MAG: FAD-binding oxidoreductase [Candidatus Omnitrophota bacterium]
MLRKNDQTLFGDYLEDSSGLDAGFAKEIVYPETEDELVDFIKELAVTKLACTISGAGTGVVGGRIPQGGIILATDKLNKIIDIQKNDQTGLAVIEPGVSIDQLRNITGHQGLTYLPDPTEKSAFIGGTIATNASGACGFKYGATRNYVRGLRIVLANGEILDINRGKYILEDSVYIPANNKKIYSCPLPTYQLPSVKNSAGYFVGKGADLIDLFIGQEGTLGVVSQVRVLLSKIPEENFSGIVFLDTNKQALELVNQLKKTSFLARRERQNNSINVDCIEYFDKNSLSMLENKYPQLPKNKIAAVYFQQNIIKEHEIKIMEQYTSFLAKIKIDTNEVWFAQTRLDKEMMTSLRHDLPELINEKIRHNGFSKISTDIAVPDTNFFKFFNFYHTKALASKIEYCLFGHIGENHLHLNFLPRNDFEFNQAKQIYREFINEAIRLKGTVAAEHGIGKLKREYLKEMLGEKGLKEMAIIKHCLDPDLLFSPGNIFDPLFLSRLSNV